ncbi:3'-5' exonuclease [Microcystis phage MinS1]|nr:3'-5' exonuclease [Microcystis phage MinS1]
MTLEQWREIPYTVLDLETTGIDALEDRIIQAAVIHFTPGARPVVRTWLLDPGIEIPTAASDVHGWTADKIRGELDGRQAYGEGAGHPRRWLTRADALWEITGLLALSMGHDHPVVAFNAAYDLTMLEAENARHGVDPLTSRLPRGKVAPILDPFVIDKAVSRRKGKRTLTDQCAHYTVPHTGAHDAAGDALATGRLVHKVLAAAAKTKAHARMVEWTPRMLHEAQVRWRVEQMDSLRAYFDRQGIAHDGCDPGWPLHTALQGGAKRRGAA